MFFIDRPPYGFFSFPVDHENYFVEVSCDEECNKIIIVFQDKHSAWMTNNFNEAKILLAILEFKEVFSETFSLVFDHSSEDIIINVPNISMIITDGERKNIIFSLERAIGKYENFWHFKLKGG
jgi:hypothetical protein